MIFLLFLLFAGVVLLEVPPMVKKKMKREMVVFFIFLAMGMALSIPQSLGIRIPSPAKPIEAMFQPLLEFLK